MLSEDTILENTYVMYRDFVLKCKSGFGCYPFTFGQKVFVELVCTGEDGGCNRSEILKNARFATKEEVEAARTMQVDRSKTFIERVYGGREIEL